MSIKNQLMQKNGLVAMRLAREFITLQVGDRIKTVADYTEKYKTARGTVQVAIKLLERHYAISLDHKGHLGTFIVHLDYKVLWEFTDMRTIMGVMPLPYSKLYEGLATGLYKTASNNNIPFSLAYMRGAQARLVALSSGRYDFVITSKLAALYSIENRLEIEIAIEFGEFTYVNEHAVIFADASKRKIEDGMKVGIDRSSIDHRLLTLNQCDGKDVELVDLAYNQIIMKLNTGEIDVAIWNIDEIIEKKLNIKYYPLSGMKFEGQDTEAVMVVNKDNYEIKNLLEHFINKAKVREYQKGVVQGSIIPSY